ncbi:reverse transcriptase domain-containing protein [Tanacetum coccineum]
MSLSRDKVTKVPVWVKVHKVVPIVAYSEDGLSIIVTQLGKPIMLEAFTNAMCAEPWGRLGFARALIEVTTEKDLKQAVTMAILLWMERGLQWRK